MGIKCRWFSDFGVDLLRKSFDIPFKQLFHLTLVFCNKNCLTIGIKPRTTGSSRHLVIFTNGNWLHSFTCNESMVIPYDYPPGGKIKTRSKSWCRRNTFDQTLSEPFFHNRTLRPYPTRHGEKRPPLPRRQQATYPCPSPPLSEFFRHMR